MTPSMLSTIERAAGTLCQNTLFVPIWFSGQDIGEDPLYVVFHVVASEDSFPVGLGDTAKSRNVGEIQVTVFGPRGEGSGPTGDIAHSIWQYFSRRPIEVPGEGWITMKDGGVKDLGGTGEQHSHRVKVPYWYDFKING